MTEVLHEGGERELADTVDLSELRVGDRVVVTTQNSVYDFEVADGSEHSIGGGDDTDFLTIKSYKNRHTMEELGLTHGRHYRSPDIVFLGSIPLDREARTIDELDHHKIQKGASFLVRMDGQERDGQHTHRFEFTAVEVIELQRRSV